MWCVIEEEGFENLKLYEVLYQECYKKKINSRRLPQSGLIMGLCDRCVLLKKESPNKSVPLSANCGHSFCLQCFETALNSKERTILRDFCLINCRGLTTPNSNSEELIVKNPIFPRISDPFDKIYVQGATIGLASYYFDSNLTNCHIMYHENVAPWQDDAGKLLPLQKFFQNVSYNSSTRKFKGVINWDVTVQGAKRWEYEFQFSSDFYKIEQGTCTPFSSKNDILQVHRYEHELNYRLVTSRIALKRVHIVALLFGLSTCQLKKRRKCSFKMIPKELYFNIIEMLF